MECSSSKSDTTARLVLGYLKNECRHAYKVFLKSKFPNKGKHISTRIAGQSLTDILKVHEQIYEIVQSRLEETNYYREKSRDHASPFYLSEQLLYLLDNRAQYTPASTPCPRSPCDSVAPSVMVEGNPYSVQSTHQPSSSEVETTPEDALPGNLHLQCSSENSYFSKTPKRRPATMKLNKSANLDKLPISETDVNEVMSEVTQTLLKNKEFHEKLANNINFVLNTVDFNEEELREMATAELNATIQNVMKKTEEDPSFDDVVETLLVDTPIAQSISKAIVDGTCTPTTSNSYPNAYNVTRSDYYQTNCMQAYTSSSSLTSSTVNERQGHYPHNQTQSTISSCSKTNDVIVFDGSLENYVKTSNSDSANTVLDTPQVQKVQNPLYVNTGNVVLMQQGVATNCQYTNANNTGQYYLVNQPIIMQQNQPQHLILQNGGIQPVTRKLTEDEILAMPTVILSDSKKQSAKKDNIKKPKTLYPKVKVEIATNLKEYINLYNANQDSPDVKVGLKKVIPPKTSTSRAKDQVQDLPTLDHRDESTEPQKTQSASTVNQDESAASSSNESKKESAIVEAPKQKGDRKSSQRSIKSNSNVKTPSPSCSGLRKPTPKSGSHVRTLTFATPPRHSQSQRSRSSQKKLEQQSRSPDFIHKKQAAAKSLFKPKTNSSDNISVKEINKKPWDLNIRTQLGITASPEKKKKSPKLKRKRDKKIIKRQLNTTEEDGLSIENALKSPEIASEVTNETKNLESNAEEIVHKDGNNAEVCLKKILSPSKLQSNKKILRTEANVSSDGISVNLDDITPNMEKIKVQNPISTKRNISFLPETTPIKDDFDFKTDLTPGFSTLTPMTQLLKANGINDSLAIDTPNFPLTPGTFLTHEPSPYYEPDEKTPDHLEEETMEEMEKRIVILSDVTVSESKREKNGIFLNDHLRKFNQNIIGKKNLNLMNREEPSVDFSPASSDNTSEDSDSESGETNETVICNQEEHKPEIDDAEPKQSTSGYSLRTRKKSVCNENGKETVAETRPKSISKGKKDTDKKCELEAVEEVVAVVEETVEITKPEAVKKATVIEASNSYNIKEVLHSVKPSESSILNRQTLPMSKCTLQEMILSELELKKQRFLKGLKDAEGSKKKRKNEDRTVKVRERASKSETSSMQTRKRKRKSDSPQKVLATFQNTDTDECLQDDLNPSSRKLREKEGFKKSYQAKGQQQSNQKDGKAKYTMEPGESHKKSLENDSKIEEASPKADKNLGDDQEKKNDSGNKSKDFFPELSSDEDEDDPEKDQLVAGLFERGIHLVPNKSPKKKVQKQTVEGHEPVPDSKNTCEEEAVCSPDFMSIKNEFDIFQAREDDDFINMEFDENNKTTKKFEDYNLAALGTARVYRIEADVGDVDVKLSFSPFSSLLDIESNAVNVLIPKKTRNKPTINVDRMRVKSRTSESNSKEKVLLKDQKPETIVIDTDVGEVDENLSIPHSASLPDLESTAGNVPKRTRIKPTIKVDKIDRMRVKSRRTSSGTISAAGASADEANKKEKVLLKDEKSETAVVEESLSEIKSRLDVATTTPGRCSERSEGYDELMNFAVMGSNTEESGEETVKRKRKHRTESTSSNSAHADKKSKTNVDPKLIKGLDIPSFLDKIPYKVP